MTSILMHSALNTACAACLTQMLPVVCLPQQLLLTAVISIDPFPLWGCEDTHSSRHLMQVPSKGGTTTGV